jgi:hypothetical protein
MTQQQLPECDGRRDDRFRIPANSARPDLHRPVVPSQYWHSDLHQIRSTGIDVLAFSPGPHPEDLREMESGAQESLMVGARTRCSEISAIA